MGLLSWITGKSPKQEETNPFPSDHVIVGKIARLIEFQLYEEEGGLAELLKPTCALVLSLAFKQRISSQCHELRAS
jgi:hypothetical protein